jgi:hypothetical protein
MRLGGENKRSSAGVIDYSLQSAELPDLKYLLTS